MEPEKHKTEPTQLKKKKKNKGWDDASLNPAPEPTPQQPVQPLMTQQLPTQSQPIIPPTPEKGEYEAKKLSQMASTYHIDMNLELGSGFTSVAYLGENIHTHQIVCVKVIDCIALGSEHARHALNRQIKYLKSFDCKHIVKLIDVYESPSFCYLVMQFCQGGDLFKFLMNTEALHPLFVRQLIEQICLGLLELKKKALIHRDLKTENIFLGKEMQAKIGDLGFCVTHEEDNVIDNVGSPIYMSPEVLQGGSHTFESDIYGLGVIWYELLHKRAPWQAKTEAELIDKKTTQKVQFLRLDLSQFDRSCLSKCLSLDPKQRCSVQQILEGCSAQNLKQIESMKLQSQQVEQAAVESMQ